MHTALNTEFASPERAAPESINEQYASFAGSNCRGFLDALPTIILVLNQQRQIVFANKAALRFLGLGQIEELLGQRPGEAFGCVNANVGPAGCGTSKHCQSCGAVMAILAAIDGEEGTGECKMLRRDNALLECLDLEVTASPLHLGVSEFVVFAITDITDEIRRRSMERIFFHDVLNLAGGISGLVELLGENAPTPLRDEYSVLSRATKTLVDEILAQRELLAAESGDLTPRYESVGTRKLLADLARLYQSSPAGLGQQVTLGACADLTVETDFRLAQRVLGNMIKNALEAGAPGDIVTLCCEDEGQALRLTVHNRAHIPQGVQESIFHRRFSTKAENRGLGTYSMLLLSERYLGGSVGFSSTEAGGTTFFLRLPKRLQKA